MNSTGNRYTGKYAMPAGVLASIGKDIANEKGYTVEIDLDSDLYTGPTFDRVFYGTPRYRGLRCSFAVHETDGLTQVYSHPDDEELVREALAAL